jgi:YVTN family beta-propeller protein
MVARKDGPLPVRQGSTIARAPEDDILYVADEDHKAVRVLALPLDAAQTAVIEMPGRPAQVLPTSTSVLVTIRDPGLLLVMAREGNRLIEKGRVKLPADAWGVALSPDQKRAVVTSAWTHKVSVIDLETRAVIGVIDVRREPRGVLVDNEGQTAWVSHLVGSPHPDRRDRRGQPAGPGGPAGSVAAARPGRQGAGRLARLRDRRLARWTAPLRPAACAGGAGGP